LGSDTYVFRRGSGQDRIQNGAHVYYSQYENGEVGALDTVELPDLNLSDVVFSREGDNLVVKVKDSLDTLTLDAFFYNDAAGAPSVHQFRFADGSTVDRAFVKAAVQAAGEEDDLALGYATADVLQGQAGNDKLEGRGGNDVLDGGVGDDILDGGSGANVYLFGRGDGRDRIEARPAGENTSTVRSTLEFKAGVAPTDVIAKRVGDALEVSIVGTGDKVTIQSFYANGTPANNANPVQNVRFADGTVWDLVKMFEPHVERTLYDAAGRVVGQLDAAGYLTQNVLDGQGRLIKTVSYATQSPGNPDTWPSATVAQLVPTDSAKDRATHFLYNAKGQRIAQIDAEGYLTENVFDAAGNVLQTIRYATALSSAAVNGALATAGSTASASTAIVSLRPISTAQDQTQLFVYDDLNRLVRSTNAEGTVTEYVYNSVGKLIQTKQAVGTPEVRTLTARYDQQGRLVGELSSEGAALLNGNQTLSEINAIWVSHGSTHSYDAAGRRTSTVDANGLKTVYFYDADSRLVFRVNAMGEVQETRYNEFGQVSSTLMYAQRSSTVGLTGGLLDAAQSSAFNALAETANDSRTSFDYDQAGRLIKTTDAEGGVVSSSYNALGEEGERRTSIAAGQSVSTLMTYDLRGQLTSTQTDTDGLNIIQRSEYDAFGRLVRSVDGNGNISSQNFDRLGRVITQTQPTGMGLTTTSTTSTSYDAFGRTLSQTDALNQTTVFSYGSSAADRSMAVTTPEGITVSTVRNRFGQTSSVTDGNSQTTSYQYDRNGNLVSTASPLTQTSSRFDTANRLIETVDANGIKVSYAYDPANRLLSRTLDPTGLAQETRYEYDAKGQQISVIDANGIRTAVAYDRKGQVLSQTIDPEGLALQTRYAYDQRGKVLTATGPDGLVTQYTYDKLGRRIQEVVDPSGLALTTAYTFDANNNVTSRVDGNGQRTRYVYDERNQLVYTIDALGQVQSNAYDSLGRVTETRRHNTLFSVAGLGETVTLAQVRSRFGASGQDRVEFRQYDADGRVTSTVNELGEVTTFAYDDNGNVVNTHRYAQRIPMYLWTPGTPPAPVVDAAQDLVTRSAFDALNRLVFSVDAVGGLTQFSYDANGNVLERTSYNDAIALTTPVTVTDLSAAAASITNRSSTRYAYGVDNRLLMTTAADGQRQWFLYDAAGRTSASIDAQGALTEYKYNGNNQVTQTISYAQRIDTSVLVDANGQPTTAFNANIAGAPVGSAPVTLAGLRPAASGDDVRSWKIYDPAGQLSAEINGLGNVTVYQRDAAGRVNGSTQFASAVNVNTLGDGTQVALFVDGGSLIIGQTTRGSGGAVVGLTALTTNSQDRQQEQVLDDEGRVLATIDALGFLTENHFDATGRLVQTVAYANPVANFSNAAAFASSLGLAQATGSITGLRPASTSADLVSFNYYNGLGQLVGQVDAENYLTETVYDSQNQVLQTIRYANRITVTPSVGSRLDDLRPNASSQDHRTTAVWNGLGLIQNQVGAEGANTAYRYDAAGRLVTTQFAVGEAETRQATVRHDAQGRVLAELSPQGAALITPSSTNAEIDAIWAQHGTFYNLNASGQRISSQDPNGLRSLYFYDGEGRLRYSVNAAGEVTERGYDAFGRVTQSISFATRLDATTLAAMTGGVLNTTANQASALALDAARSASGDNSVLQYRYDTAGRLVQTTDAEGHIVSNVYNAFGDQTELIQSLELGQTSRNVMAYDQRGQRTSVQSDPIGLDIRTSTDYDAFGRAVRTVDGNGTIRSQTYDRLGRAITLTQPAGMGSGGTSTISSSYDAFGRTLSQTDALGHTTVYGWGYSRAERSSSVTTPEGIVVTTQHNAFGQTRSIVDGKGQTTSYQYDLNGNLVKTTDAQGQETRSSFDAANRLIETTDAKGNKVSYTYDAANRVFTRTVDPTGLILTTEYSYDAKGQQVSVIDASGNRTDVVYDRNGQVLRQIVDPARLALETEYAYDTRGNVVTVKQPDGSVTAYRYDALGRREQELVDPNGLQITRSYFYDANGNVTSMVDANDQRTRYAYDELNQLVYTVDPLGQVRYQAYDAKGRVTQTRVLVNAISLAGLGDAPSVAQVRLRISESVLDTVEYRQYDKDDRLTSTVNGLGEVTTYSYDNNGNVLEVRTYANRINLSTWTAGSIPPVVADIAQDQRVTNTYDGLNRVVHSTNALNQTTTFTYDANGNLIERTLGNERERYAYDAANRWVVRIDGVGGFTRRELDGVGRVQRETRFANTQNNPYTLDEPVADSARDQVLRHVYDAAGRERFTLDATGAVQESRFDANGQVIERIAYVTRIDPGVLAQVTALSASVVAHAADRRVRYGYDAAQRLTLKVDGTGAVTQNVYDGKGNVVKQIGYATPLVGYGVATTPAASTQDRVSLFVYDAADRRTAQIDALGGVTEFKYDAKGNVLQQVAYAIRSSAPSAASQAADATAMVAQAASASSTGATTATGANRISRQTYDAENRTTFSIDATGAVMQMRYDAFGQVRAQTAYATRLSASTLAALPFNLTGSSVQSLLQPSAQDRTTVATFDTAGRMVHSIDAAGFVTSRVYDGAGRLTQVTEHTQALSGLGANLDTDLGTVLSLDAIQARLDLIPVANTEGNRIIRFSYDGAGQLLSSTDAMGRTESTSYDGIGQQLSHTDKNNAVWNYRYDAGGNMVEQLDPEVSLSSVTDDGTGHLVQGAVTQERIVTRFEYDGAGQLSTKTEAFGRAEQRTTIYGYDGEGRLNKTTLPPVGVYDSADLANLASSGATGAARTEQWTILTTEVVYDAFGQAITQIDAAGHKTHRVYDRLGQARFDIDALGQVSSRGFDAFGNVTQFTRHAQGLAASPATAPNEADMGAAMAGMSTTDDRTITTQYDSRNMAVKVTQPEVWFNNGQGGTGQLASPVTENSYDAFGQLVQSRQLVDPGSSPSSATWLTSRNVYDLRGNQVALIDGMGYLSTQTFDNAGNLTLRTEYANALAGASYASDSALATFAAQFAEVSYLLPTPTTPPAAPTPVLPTASDDDRSYRFEYDKLNRKVTHTLVNASYSNAPDGTRIQGDLVTRYGYDALGQLTSTTDALNQTTYTSYDALGRITSVQAPGTTINGNGYYYPLTIFNRDALGNVVVLRQQGITEADRVTLTQFDSHSHARQITQANTQTLADGSIVNAPVSQFFSYTATGQLAKQWQAATGNDGSVQTLFTAIEYDALGQQLRTITPASTSVVGGGISVVSQSAAGTVVQDNVYNAFGEVTSRGTSGFAQRETFAYDNAGRVVRKFTANQAKAGVVSFALYDLLGRQTVGIESNGTANLSSVLTASAADALGNNGVRRTDYQLDLLGRALQVNLPQREDTNTATQYRPTVHQTFDRWGNLLSQSDPRLATWVTTYQYNANNQLVRKVLPQVGTFNAYGVASSITPTTEVYYDAVGQQVAERDANGNVSGKVWDAAGRLQQELNADGGVITHGYNAFGDKTQLTDAMGYTTRYGYDQLGRNTSISTDSVDTYTLGADYSLTHQGSQQLTTRMEYDQAGRLLKQTNAANEQTQYAYDARGNIIATVDPLGHTSRAAFDAQGNQIGSVNANGDLTTQQIDYFGQMSSRTDLGGATINLQYDQAGQLTQQTSTRGQNIGYQYDAAGNLLHVTDAGVGRQSHYAYDARGARIFEQTTQGTTDVQRQSLAYDSLGRLAYVEAQDGIRLHRDYDAQGNLLRQTVQTDLPLPSTTEGLTLTEVGKAWTQIGTEQVPDIDPNTGLQRTDPVTGALLFIDKPIYGWKAFSELRNTITTAAGSRTSQTQWFAYDAMNRQILVDGAVNGNAQDQANLTADQGHILTYDKNGNRTSDTKFGRQVTATPRPYATDEGGNLILNESGLPQYGVDEAGIPLSATVYSVQLGAVTETYTYDRNNRITGIQHQTLDAGTGQISGSQTLDNRYYDAAGRLIQNGPAGQLNADFVSALTGESLTASGLVSKKTQYDAAGRLLRQQVLKADGSLSYELVYQGEAQAQMDALGNSLASYMRDDKGNIHAYTKTFDKRDSYLETNNHGSRSDNLTRYSDVAQTYDVNGHLTKVSETDWPEDNPNAGAPGPNMERLIINDVNGMLLKKEQQGNALKQLVVNGQVITAYGKGTDPNKQINAEGKPNYVDQGQFGATFEAISNRNATGSSSYTVQAGDTLQGLAQGLWGDASQWYRIADANGLSGIGPEGALTPGMRLSLPSQVSGLHNTSSTHKPYDPSQVIGDTTPSMPAPPAGKKCGGLGQIIMIIVAIVVTVVLTVYGGPAGGQAGMSFWQALVVNMANPAIAVPAAMAGAAVSQMVGVATGIIEDFDWKAIAVAGISAGVGGQFFTPAQGAHWIVQAAAAAANQAINNALTQGVLLITGLQEKPDWKAIAAAAVGGAAGSIAGSALGATSFGQDVLGKVGTRAVTGAVTSAATAYTHARLNHKRLSESQIGVAAFQGGFSAGLYAYGNQEAERADVRDREARGEAPPPAPTPVTGWNPQFSMGVLGRLWNAGQQQFQQNRALPAVALEDEGWVEQNRLYEARNRTPITTTSGVQPEDPNGDFMPRGSANQISAVQPEDPNGNFMGPVRRAAIAGKGQGPLAIGQAIDADNQYAAFGYMVGSKQVSYDNKTNRWITHEGKEYNADLSNLSPEQIAKLDQLGRQLTTAEGKVDVQRAAARAQAATESYKNAETARLSNYPARTSENINASRTAASAGGSATDYVDTNAFRSPEEITSTGEGTSFKEGLKQTAINAGKLLVGGTEIVVGGTINSGIRIVGGLASIPVAAVKGVDAGVAVQESAATLNYKFRSEGAQMIGQAMEPVAKHAGEVASLVRNVSERYLGDGVTTVLGATLQFGVEAALTVAGGNSLKKLVDFDLTPSSAARSTTTSVAAEVSETVAAARVRQVNMLADNEAFNISPKSWDQYPTIGRNGTFVTDRAGVMKYFDDVPAGQTKVVISAERAAVIEADMGLVAGTLEDGFKLRQVTGVRDMMPNSPTVGNEHFLGAGRHLPGGAPEMVINSIPTVDNAAVRTLMEVRVGARDNGLTIAANPANGNPAAIVRGLGTLNARQAAVLGQLPEYGSKAVVHKSFGQKDLAALTAATGDEFAMFSTGGRRLIYRGNAEKVPITPEIGKALAGQGWRWSSHVHPGFDAGVLRSSVGDRAVLEAMGGERSALFNSLGQRRNFTPAGDSLEGWKPW
jgi:YD repeat-containing protein